MTHNKRSWQKIVCYLFLVLLATFLGYAGARWVESSITYLFPRAFSPDGTRFISAQIVDGGFTYHRFHVRDSKDGQIVADLSGFQWIDGYRYKWSPDGTHIGGVARTRDRKDYRIISVQIHPRVELAAEYPLDRDGRLQGIDFSDQNELIVQHFCLNNVLEFRTDGKVSAKFKVGRDENVTIEQTIGDVVQLQVIPSSDEIDEDGNPAGDFLFTNGQDVTHVLVDRRDGSVRSKFESPRANTSAIGGTIKYVLRRSTPNRAFGIYDIENLEKPLIELPKYERPIFVVGQEAVTVSRQSTAIIHAYNLVSGQKRLIFKSDFMSVPIGPNPRPIVAVGRLKNACVNLKDGKTEWIVDLSISPAWKWSMFLGLPLLWILWIAVGVLLGSRFPFLDMIALCVLTVLVVMVWSMLLLREYRPDLSITAVGMVSMATGAMLVLIWGSTSKTFWGTLLPACVASIALIVLLIRVWSYNSSFRIVEGMVGGTIGLGFQILGLWMLRQFAGRIARREKVTEETDVSSQRTTTVEGEAQMTMRQGLALMLAFCVLFAIVCQANPREFFRPGVGLFLIWMTLFTTQMSVAAVTAAYFALRWKNIVASFLCAVSVSSFYSILVYAVTRNWQLNLLMGPLGRWILPVICGALVWVAMRYCGFHGFQFERKSQSTRHARRDETHSFSGRSTSHGG